MFKESPFTGDCIYATGEVLIMLFGSILLGMILGYLIWGWLRKKVDNLTGRISELEHIVELKDSHISGLQNRVQSLEKSVKISSQKIDLTENKFISAINRINSLLSTRQNVNEESDPGSENTKGQKTELAGQEPFRSETAGDRDFVVQIEEQKTEEKERKLLNVASDILGVETFLDDLGIFVGISQEADKLLRDKGINSWEKLADTQLPLLRIILERAGLNPLDHNLKSWPRQAQMAARGEWKKLNIYQEKLRGDD